MGPSPNLGLQSGMGIKGGMYLQGILQLLQSGRMWDPNAMKPLMDALSGRSSGAGMEMALQRGYQRYDKARNPDPFGWGDWLQERYPDQMTNQDPVQRMKQAPSGGVVAESLGYDGSHPFQNSDYTRPYPIAPKGQILQTLKSAGWDPSMGYGPQESFAGVASGNKTPEQIAKITENMNKLVYAAAPQYDPSRKIEIDHGPRATREFDPQKGMESAINRDAYVNETLGGNFAGGVIPEYTGDEKMYDIHAQDPHFPVANRDAEGNLMLAPGWASNQATQFGSLPYDAFHQQQAQNARSGNQGRNIWTGMDNTSMQKDFGDFDPYENLMGQFPVSSMNAWENNQIGGNSISYSPYNEVAQAIESNGGVWGGAIGSNQPRGSMQMGAGNQVSFNQSSPWGGDTNKNPWGSNVWG